MKSITKSIILFAKLAVCGIAILALLFGFIWLRSRRHPLIYILPDHYRGWAQIAYGVKEAPPLPMEHRAYILNFPPNGRLATSTLYEEGWATDKYYYVHEDKAHELDNSLVGFGYTEPHDRYADGGNVIARGPIEFSQFIGSQAEFDKNPPAYKWEFPADDFTREAQ